MDFFVKAKSSTIEGFYTNGGFYVVKNPFFKHSLSINERFSTIEGSTIEGSPIEGFQCTVDPFQIHWVYIYKCCCSQ